MRMFKKLFGNFFEGGVKRRTPRGFHETMPIKIRRDDNGCIIGLFESDGKNHLKDRTGKHDQKVRKH